MENGLKFVFIFFLSITLAFSQTKITILHTNNVNGTLENCRCVDQPLGSLEKIKGQVDKIRSSGKNVLFLDSGDFFSPFGDNIKNQYLLKTFKLMNYDAATPGDQAFAGKMSFFRESIFPARFPYVSLNKRVEGIKAFSAMKVMNLNVIRINIIELSS